MARIFQEELRHLSPAQRTLFHALKRHFSARLGFSDADLLYTVRRTFIPSHYAAGHRILRAGDYLDLFMVAAAGTVKITCADDDGREIIVQMIGDGHAFGLPSLARSWQPRRFGAVAHSESIIGLVTPDALRDIIARLDTARRLRLLMYGWRGNIGLLLEKRCLLPLLAKDRIWFMLGRLALRASATGREAGYVGMELTQTDIAELIGVTRPTVSRKLTEFPKSVLSHRRRRYYVYEQPSFARSTDFATVVPVGASPLHDDLARKEIVSCLRQHADSMGLPRSAVDAFVHHARLVVCAPGAQIALPDHSEALSLLITGAARVECPGARGEPLPLLFAKPGWLILGGAPPKGRIGFRAIAHVESCAAILNTEGLARVVDAMTASEFLRFLSFAWRVLSHHTWRGCQSLVTHEQERIYQLLQQLGLDFPAAHDNGTIIDLPLSTTDIARMVAAGEASVRRHLTELETAGRIGVVEGSIPRILVIGLFPNPRVA